MLEENSTLRIKCAMIVYAIERELGRYVREHNSQLESHETAKEILKRTTSTLSNAKEEYTQVIVENSFLGEILAMALSAARGSTDLLHLQTIDKLSQALGLFEIRNAVSHPNRSFHDSYWYRCAAIAADPALDALNFYEVSLALQNAIDGKLVEPPENWLYKKRWAVPTVLPSEFEHSITGLFGRANDIKKLIRDIKDSRAPLIALIARGGVGKTSLLLQVISDFCLSVEAPHYFDGVFWASFKQEKLTSSGIEILTAPQGITELEQVLCHEANETYGLKIDNFLSMKTILADKKLLLCLDNLETLLRDSPKEFNDFYQELPSSWKVIVTSRIPVDNAKNIPLDVLDKAGGIALGRAYFSSQGKIFNDDKLLEKICTNSNNNPLAIRLTIELYLAGKDITLALQQSEQDVLAFSFKNLLELLEQSENDILESVFVFGQPNRSDICSALDIDADQASEAVSKLSKMSLIVRQETESQETFVLGAGIRDLLRSQPRNLLTRTRIVGWLGRNRTSAQETLRHQTDQKISPCELSYFPISAHSSLVEVCRQIKAAARREDRNTLVNIEIELRKKLDSQPSSLLHRLYAWTALELDDLSTATTHFKQASILDIKDPAPLFGLALALQTLGNWSELEVITDKLIIFGYGDAKNAGRYFANRIWALHLQSLNIQEKLEEVVAATNTWSENIDLIPAFAVGRASAYRRIVSQKCKAQQNLNEIDAAELGKLMSLSCAPMLKILVHKGFFKWYIPELKKIIAQIQFLLDHGVTINSFQVDDKLIIQSLLKISLSNNGVRAGLDEINIKKLLNNFDVRKIQDEVQFKSLDNLLKDGYLITKVKNGTKYNAEYFFAQDERGIDYYVHLDEFELGSLAKRSLISPGASVALKFNPEETGNALRATEAWLVK